ncbi:MAG: (2Fe-2S)-binding protein [Candidatus Binatia bacterium]
MKREVRIKINGQIYQEEVEPRLLLSYFIREAAGLTGTHVGCVIGECGACSVLVDGKLVKSCLLLAVQVDGKEILTVEGMAKNGELHTIQEAFVEKYGLQCGYCTPGMILAAHYLLSHNLDPTDDEIRKGLSGNLCMCTGYMQIVEAVKEAARRLKIG